MKKTFNHSVLFSFLVVVLFGCGSGNSTTAQGQLEKNYFSIECETSTRYQPYDQTLPIFYERIYDQSIETVMREPDGVTEHYTTEFYNLDENKLRTTDADNGSGTVKYIQVNSTDLRIEDTFSFTDFDSCGRSFANTEYIVNVWRKKPDGTSELIFNSINGAPGPQRKIIRKTTPIDEKTYRTERTYLDVEYYDRSHAKAMSRVKTCLIREMSLKPTAPLTSPKYVPSTPAPTVPPQPDPSTCASPIPLPTLMPQFRR